MEKTEEIRALNGHLTVNIDKLKNTCNQANQAIAEQDKQIELLMRKVEELEKSKTRIENEAKTEQRKLRNHYEYQLGWHLQEKDFLNRRFLSQSFRTRSYLLSYCPPKTTDESLLNNRWPLCSLV